MTSPAPPAPRGARFSPDRPFVGIGVVLVVLIVMLAAMAFSFIALYEAAEWTHNPREFWWLAPVIIDGPILVYTASYAVWRWRDIERFAAHAMRVLIFFTGLSVTVNALHVCSGWQWTWTSPEMYGGIAMAAVAPIGALLAAHELTRLVFMNHGEPEAPALVDAAPVDDSPAVVTAAPPTLVALPPLPVEVADVAAEQASSEGVQPATAPPLEASPAEAGPALQAEPEPEPETEPAPEPRQRPTRSLLIPEENVA